jgi:hypothetical protein
MTGRQCVAWRGLVSVVLLWSAGCTREEHALSGSWSDVCIDLDGDGHGFQCAGGDDCDESDPAVHAGCHACRTPEQGCSCDAQPPLECRLPHALDPSGALLCREGTRYCRDGRWSACEGVASFLVPAAGAVSHRALIDRDAAPVVCDPCNPDCYRVEDPLLTSPGLDVGTNVVLARGGGVTLGSLAPDAGSPSYNQLLDEAACASDDTDCDGLPDAFDAQPGVPLAGFTHRAIFMDLPPAASAASSFEGGVQLGSADIYFYLDTTSFMEGVRDRLIAELTAGNFLAGAGAALDCADTDGDGAPNQELKSAGIAGNAACLLRDARFGAGWFRDIPFRGPYAATGDLVATWDYEMFEHRRDITADAASVGTALASFVTRSNLNTPEGGMQGLWALATGAELYAGWDRPGIPARRDCPAGSWGYPCFRSGSLPIIVQFTDAPMQNGPPTPARSGTNPPTPADCLSNAIEAGSGVECAPLEYDQRVLAGLHVGSEGRYRALTRAAETFADAEPVGVIDGVLVTYAGSSAAMRADVTYNPGLFIACPYRSNAWSPEVQAAPDAVFRFRVAARGDYLVSARGSRFDTTLMLLQIDAAGTPTATLACADDSVDDDAPPARGDSAELELTLDPGEYAVVLKGYRETGRGAFQLTLGSRAQQTQSEFQAQRWLGPAGDGAAGTLRALNERSIRVITLQSSADWHAAQQAQRLASATRAVAADGAPLTFQIGAAGSGLGSALVQALQQVTGGLTLDVGLSLLQAPDDPSPDFELSVEAVDQGGDGCAAPADRDGDPAQLPDTHTQCGVGATPRFQVTFRNPPAPGNVPPHPTNPGGGYHMVLQVVGDGNLVLDRIPVYIVPSDAVPDPLPDTFAGSGHYQQEVPTSGCSAGEGATWRALYWNATLPEGTRIRFEICAGDSDEELAQCAFMEAFELVPGAPCAGQDECGPTGYCDVSGFCHQVLGPPCMVNEECGPGGLCVDGGAGPVCSAQSNALDLRMAALAAAQGRQRGVVRVELQANAAGTQAPTLRNWRVDYSCASRE